MFILFNRNLGCGYISFTFVLLRSSSPQLTAGDPQLVLPAALCGVESRRHPHFHLLAYGQHNTASGA